MFMGTERTVPAAAKEPLGGGGTRGKVDVRRQVATAGCLGGGIAVVW